jgi:hypothetical protein
MTPWILGQFVAQRRAKLMRAAEQRRLAAQAAHRPAWQPPRAGRSGGGGHTHAPLAAAPSRTRTSLLSRQLVRVEPETGLLRGPILPPTTSSKAIGVAR